MPHQGKWNGKRWDAVFYVNWCLSTNSHTYTHSLSLDLSSQTTSIYYIFMLCNISKFFTVKLIFENYFVATDARPYCRIYVNWAIIKLDQNHQKYHFETMKYKLTSSQCSNDIFMIEFSFSHQLALWMSHF